MLEKLYAPKDVVIIGVSPSPRNLARNIVGNLMELGFGGEVFLVGRSQGFLFGHRIRQTVDQVPDGIDLAVIMVPARVVPEVLEQCGKKGIKHAIIQTGGFRELGEEGEKIEKQMRKVALQYGIKFVGPNCLGVISPSTGLGAVFLPIKRFWQKGNVSVVAQSGGVGVTYLYQLASENIGLARFFSIGNKMSLDETDYIRMLNEDEETGVIAMYLEDIHRGREFFHALLETKKPVIIQKANRTPQGRKVAFSHTAAIAQDDKVLSQALRQANVIRANTVAEMISYIKTFQLPPFKGNRCAIIARSGGHAVIAADSAYDAQFELPEFPTDFLDMVKGSFQSEIIKRGNPLDLGDLYDFDQYAKIMEMAASLPNIDVVVMIHEYFAILEGEQSRKLLPKAREIANRFNKPVCLVLYTDEREIAHLKREYHFPFFTSIEETFSALQVAMHWHSKGASEHVYEVSHKKETFGIEKYIKQGKKILLVEGFEILSKLGIQSPEYKFLQKEEEACEDVRFPVAVKVILRQLSHKSDVGGVRLNVDNHQTLKETIKDMWVRFGTFEEGEGILVQSMVKHGIEMIVGGLRDQCFGPVITVGAGGIFVEMLKDIAMRLAPVSLDEALTMIKELKTYKLLKGYRNMPEADIDALANIIVKVSNLITMVEDIQEIDLNPVIVKPLGDGASVVDVRILLK